MKRPLSGFTMLWIALFAALAAGCTGPQQENDTTPAASSPAPQHQAGWKVIGPGGGGAQFEPTISPADPNHVFVRCDMTGAYVTEDGGGQWRMFNLRTVVRDFEFDPNEPNTVYACNSGLYRSRDKGKRWTLLLPEPGRVTAETMSGDHAGQRFVTEDELPGGSMHKIRVDPANNDRIYVGASGPGRRGGKSKLLYSADKGESWKQVAEVEGGSILAIFPGSWHGKPDEVTVVTGSAMARVNVSTGQTTAIELPADNVLVADGGKGGNGVLLYLLASLGDGGGRRSSFGSTALFSSADLGASWQRADASLKIPQGAPADSRIVCRAMAVCQGTPETVYLSCASMPVMMSGKPQRQGGILRTSDGGKSWRWVLATSAGDVLSENFSQGWLKRNLGWFRNPSHLGVSPTDPDVAYGTDSGRTIRTTDGGASWRQVISRDLPDRSFTTRGLDVTTTYGVHFDPYNPDHYFITYTDIGLFHTFNGGESWFHSITGIPRQWRNTCYWLEFDPDVKGRIWSVWSNVHDLPRPKMFRSGNLTNGRQQGGAALSGDGGRYWGLLNTGELGEDGWYSGRMRLGAVPTHIVIDTDSPVNQRTLYVCDFGFGVWKSTTAGRTWQLMNKGLDKANLNVWRITRLPGGRLILLVVRAGVEGRTQIPGALYYSDDGAKSWQVMAMPERVTMPNDLVYDPADPRRMYLSCWPLNVGSREIGGGLFRTEDGGKSWKQVFDEGMHVYAAAVDPRNTGTVFINTFNSSAFRSDDRGETWNRLGGYNFKWGHRPVVDPVNEGMLYLTTFGGSVYHGPAQGVPGAFEDIENLPGQRW